MIFPRQSEEPPTIITWLNRLDLVSALGKDDKLRSFADEITAEGFIAHLNTWDSSTMHGAALCWIAFPRKKADVDSGTFSTNDVRKRMDLRAVTRGRVRFKRDLGLWCWLGCV
ncbi:hypothetical protein LTR62_006307 [Meristemomyces frigidus]|uniref:H-type lectin domain-containing protein n=1 Tax=Meristemomyces frigidus TaxID=1508187 RepID=A0AAN7TDM7_9PEZI|nr:hypothetical protein LTR62_006307 [Meristemomyces frigidus]